MGDATATVDASGTGETGGTPDIGGQSGCGGTAVTGGQSATGGHGLALGHGAPGATPWRRPSCASSCWQRRSMAWGSRVVRHSATVFKKGLGASKPSGGVSTTGAQRHKITSGVAANNCNARCISAQRGSRLEPRAIYTCRACVIALRPKTGEPACPGAPAKSTCSGVKTGPGLQPGPAPRQWSRHASSR